MVGTGSYAPMVGGDGRVTPSASVVTSDSCFRQWDTQISSKIIHKSLINRQNRFSLAKKWRKQEAPFDYSREIYAGGIHIKKDGSVRNPLACTIHELNFFYKDLTRTEICQLGGNIDKKDWNAYKPIVEYGKTVPDKEISFNGITAQFIRMPVICESMTLTAKLKVNEIPQKTSGVIAGRPGFDGVLNIRTDGRFAISVWNAEKTDSLNLASKTIAKVGETYRVTAVQHARNAEIVISLYVNSKLEAREAIAGRMFLYGKDFCIQGIPNKDGLRGPLDCELLDCRAFGIAFTPEEAAAL